MTDDPTTRAYVDLTVAIVDLSERVGRLEEALLQAATMIGELAKAQVSLTAAVFEVVEARRRGSVLH